MNETSTMSSKMAGVSPEKSPLFQFLCAVFTQEKMPIAACLDAVLTDLLGRNPVPLFEFTV